MAISALEEQQDVRVGADEDYYKSYDALGFNGGR